MRADLLHVVTAISNPVRWKSRLSLYKDFEQHMLESGVKLYTVEWALGDRPFEVTCADNPMHLQIHGNDLQEIWIRDALINAGVRTLLPKEAKYIAWIDADIKFLRRDWAAETVHMLQHYAVGQVWTNSIDVAPNGDIAPNEWNNSADRSFCAAWQAGDLDDPCEIGKQIAAGSSSPPPSALAARPKSSVFKRPDGKEKDWRAHTGYGWAIRKDVFSEMGGLLDWMVTGSCDWHMARAFVGLPEPNDQRMTPAYNRRLQEFWLRADRAVKQNVGVVPGTVVHGWHGRKKDRQYFTRFDVLIDSKFDPDLDLSYDWQGIPQITGDNRQLRDGLRKLARNKNEDSVDIA
jgi:hypothetical protein